jgi:glutaredoxin
VQPLPDARIILYGATWCSACSHLKQHLAARAVSYVFVDIEDRQAMASPAGAHAAEMPAQMRNGIPVTRVAQKTGEPQWFQGDDPDRIERASR